MYSRMCAKRVTKNHFGWRIKHKYIKFFFSFASFLLNKQGVFIIFLRLDYFEQPMLEIVVIIAIGVTALVAMTGTILAFDSNFNSSPKNKEKVNNKEH